MKSTGKGGRKMPGLQKRWKPYVMLAPMLLFAIGFCYYPAIKPFLYSLCSVNFKGQITGFVGLENFRYLFTRPDFAKAIQNTLKLALINTPVTILLTLLFARLSAVRKPGRSIYELFFSLPMAVSMSAAALIFKMLLSPAASPVNILPGWNIDWLGNRNTAIWGIMMLTIWMGIGFNYLLFLSAFRNVPQSVMEAAEMDGAGMVRRFFHVELPVISPTLFYVLCTNLVQAVMTSGPIIILTDGGPARSTTTLIFMMYSSGYGSANYSLAACISLITFLITLLFTIGAFALEGKRVSE